VLRWRLTLGAVIIAALAGLCWLDARAAKPGIFLGPLALIAAWLCAGELLAMLRARGFEPVAWAFYSAALLPVAFSCVPILFFEITNNYTMGVHGWLAIGLVAGLAVSFFAEMLRFQEPGRASINVAATAFAVLYLGGCLGTIVQIRLARAPLPIGGLRGLLPLLAFIVTVKLSDICQYAFGRLFGRHKLAPRLSPGKTWEGAVGGIALTSVIVSTAIALRVYGWEQLQWQFLIPPILFTLSVAVAGLFGDLAESLLKRDAGFKDSSSWMPGFGGVLDLMDSLLLSAPVAYLWFANGFLDIDPLG
jgi:phosphatidate cytidylyltransferase